MMMIPAYNKKVCAVFPFQMGIHYRPTPFPKKMQPCLTRNSNPFDKPISRNYEGSERRYFRGRFRSIPTSLWPPLAKKSAPCASYEPWVNFRENFAKQKRFSLHFDSHRTLVWRAPGTRYHQENTIKRHRYGGAGCLVWGGIILGSTTDLHAQSLTMTGHIYRDVILKQHVRLFRGAMDAEFLFMDDNARPHRANIVDECLQLENITRVDWPAYSPNLNPIEYVWDMLGRLICSPSTPSHLSTGT
ncbi:transposable element Tcb1 transposase [Trichonephila clavipes]|nr:transposable element Tcb1 transposase [Trichonephila clavipes]